jgi:hypothetical protein
LNEIQKWKQRYDEQVAISRSLQLENDMLKGKLEQAKEEYRKLEVSTSLCLNNSIQLSFQNAHLESSNESIESTEPAVATNVVIEESEEERKQRYFKEGLKEIITTEIDYVNDLSLVQEVSVYITLHNYLALYYSIEQNDITRGIAISVCKYTRNNSATQRISEGRTRSRREH